MVTGGLLEPGADGVEDAVAFEGLAEDAEALTLPVAPAEHFPPVLKVIWTHFFWPDTGWVYTFHSVSEAGQA